MHKKTLDHLKIGDLCDTGDFNDEIIKNKKKKSRTTYDYPKNNFPNCVPPSGVQISFFRFFKILSSINLLYKTNRYSVIDHTYSSE